MKQPDYNDCCKAQCASAGLGYNAYKSYTDVVRLDCECGVKNLTTNMSAYTVLTTTIPREVCKDYLNATN